MGSGSAYETHRLHLQDQGTLNISKPHKNLADDVDDELAVSNPLYRQRYSVSGPHSTEEDKTLYLLQITAHKSYLFNI